MNAWMPYGSRWKPFMLPTRSRFRPGPRSRRRKRSRLKPMSYSCRRRSGADISGFLSVFQLTARPERLRIGADDLAETNDTKPWEVFCYEIHLGSDGPGGDAG